MARGDVLLVNLPASRRRDQSGPRLVVALQSDIGHLIENEQSRLIMSLLFALISLLC